MHPKIIKKFPRTIPKTASKDLENDFTSNRCLAEIVNCSDCSESIDVGAIFFKITNNFLKVHPFVKARKLAEKTLWTRLFFIKVECTKDIVELLKIVQNPPKKNLNTNSTSIEKISIFPI